MIGKQLPPPEIVGMGRWRDICAPITQLAVLANTNVFRSVKIALDQMREARSEQSRDSLEAQIVQGLLNVALQVDGGRLKFSLLRDQLNSDLEDKFKPSPQLVGRVLTSLGFDRSKDRQFIIWNDQLIEALRKQYGL